MNCEGFSICGKAIGSRLLLSFGESEMLVGLSWFKVRLHRVRRSYVAEEDVSLWK